MLGVAADRPPSRAAISGSPPRRSERRGASNDLTPPQRSRLDAVGNAEAEEIRALLRAYELEDIGMLEALAERSLMSARRILDVHGGGLREEPRGAGFRAALNRLLAHMQEGGMEPNQTTTRAVERLVDVLLRRQAQSAAILEKAAGLDGTGGEAAGTRTGSTGNGVGLGGSGRGGSSSHGYVTKDERDRDIVDELAKMVKRQRRDRALPSDQACCDGDVLAAYDALCHSPPRLPEPGMLSLGHDRDGTGYRHHGRKKFKHERRTLLEQRSFLSDFFSACAQGGAFPAPDGTELREIDSRSGVAAPEPDPSDDPDAGPPAIEGELVLVAHYPATMDLVQTAWKRAETSALGVTDTGRYFDKLITDTGDTMARECLTVTGALEQAIGRGFEANYSRDRKRRAHRRSPSSSDTSSEVPLSTSDSESDERPAKRPRGKGKGKEKYKPRNKPQAKDKKSDYVCYKWARRKLTDKGPKCDGGCNKPHKFNGKKHIQRVKKTLKISCAR